MQDINRQVRDREQSQTRDICFEVRAHLLYVPDFNTWRISTINRSRRITRCCNTYKEFPLELLDSLVPLLFPQEQTHRKPISSPRSHLKHRVLTRTRNTANPQVRWLVVKSAFLSLYLPSHFHIYSYNSAHLLIFYDLLCAGLEILK